MFSSFFKRQRPWGGEGEGMGNNGWITAGQRGGGLASYLLG